MKPGFGAKAGRILLPGVILQSVLIGGGFATGREIVEFGGKFGPAGLLTGVAIFVGFSWLSVLSFEACRKWEVFDYKSLLKRLLGRFWPAYELVYVLLAILIIAVMASAAGEILKTTLGLNYWIGVAVIIGLVALFNFKGESFIAKMKSVGTVALFGAYTLFGIVVVADGHEELVASFMNWESYDTSLGLLVGTGVIYVGYNLAVYPASFFTIKSLTSRRESVLAGIMSGLLMTVPWFLTFAAIMTRYPDPEVIGASIPWQVMLDPFGDYLMVIFGVVVGWTLVETATGMIHGFIQRVDHDLLRVSEKTEGLKKSSKALISAGALLVALFLSRFGIIDLIAKGYTAMSYGMIAFFALPLIWNSARILRKE